MKTRRMVVWSLLAMGQSTIVARADEGQTPQLEEGQHFIVDPVVDGVAVAGGAAFSILLQLVLSTGEIKPGFPSDPSVLLSIDRGAVTTTPDPNAGLLSSIGLYTAIGFAVLDPILSGFRDGKDALLVDAVMYAETIALTEAFTDATKIAVRRPRPVDYANCYKQSTTGCDSNTDLQLSFFSGHASVTGAITATASYLAFARSGMHSARPWITLATGVLLTAFVSYERVQSGEHFPTDVIMGSLAGAGIGTLVAHFHHKPHLHGKNLEAPSVWFGYAPMPSGGGVSMGGRF